MGLIIIDLVLLGAIVVVGYLAGELIGKIKLPKVLGYLVVGMLVGPFALNLVRPDIFATDLFEWAVLLAIGFVGYSIGSSIHVDELKSAGTGMTVIGLVQAFTPFILVSLGMYLILGFDLITSLVIGAIALATAPVVALSIIQEYKTDGPLTRILLPIVAPGRFAGCHHLWYYCRLCRRLLQRREGNPGRSLHRDLHVDWGGNPGRLVELFRAEADQV